MRVSKCIVALAISASLLAGCSSAAGSGGAVSENAPKPMVGVSQIGDKIGEACSSARGLAAQNISAAHATLAASSNEDGPSAAEASSESPATPENDVAMQAAVPNESVSAKTNEQTNPQSAHQHNWEPIIETREEVVQEGYREDHYVVYVHNYATGETTGPYESYEEAEVYMDSVIPQRTSCGLVNIGTYQPRITTTKDVVVGYRCTSCGATK